MHYNNRKIQFLLLSLEIVYAIFIIYVIVYLNILYKAGTEEENLLTESFLNSRCPFSTKVNSHPLHFKFFFACGKEIMFFDKMFAVLRNVVFQTSIDNRKLSNNSKSGWRHSIQTVSSHCKSQFVDIAGLHLIDPILSWMKTVKIVESLDKREEEYERRSVGFVITRHDVSNLYHTMTQVYNVVVAQLLLGLTPTCKNNRCVGLFMDKHGEHTDLQELWDGLFQEKLYQGQGQRFHFDTIVLINSGYEGYLNHLRSPELPLIAEFQRYIPNLFGICDQRKLSCSSINIRVILRQDEMLNNGTIRIRERKFYNERKMLEEIQNSLPGHNVRGVRLENYPMKTQLTFISHTDFLVGVHGAGLTFALFLPEHAGVLELFPRYRDTGNVHYRTISKWRNLYYRAWQNYRAENEFPNFHTRFPVKNIVYYIMDYLDAKCKGISGIR